MTIGTFILSLDCEGLWGRADNVSDATRSELSSERLTNAYTAIVGLLGKYGFNATFAFVEFFTWPPERLMALQHSEIAEQLPYLSTAMDDLTVGQMSGWAGDAIFNFIPRHHEIASHGVTHSPWDDLTREQVDFELSLSDGPIGQTFVYPRNAVGHLEVLAQLGYIGYRCALPSNRFTRLSREFWITQKSQSAGNPTATPIEIPSGEFVNWKRGARKSVPMEVTRRRVRHMLSDATRTNGVVHFWTHPENIAAEPSTLWTLGAILSEVKNAERRGEIEVLTQKDYCQKVRPD